MPKKDKAADGTQFYKKAGLKSLIVHVSEKAHGALSLLAQQEQRSLQVVARSILEQASKEPEKALKTMNEFIKAGANPSPKANSRRA